MKNLPQFILKYIFFSVAVSVGLVGNVFSIPQQKSKIDSLQSLLQKDGEDTNRVNHLNSLCREYLNNGINDSAHRYGERAQMLAQKINFKKGIGQSYHNIGLTYFHEGNYSESLKNNLFSLKIKKDIGDKKEIGLSYNNIGLVFREQGNYPEALKSHLNALKIQEELGDKRGLALTYNNIGIFYNKTKNYEKALQNHFAALKIREELGIKNGIFDSYYNIGNVYANKNLYSDALKYFISALKISEELGDKKRVSLSYQSFGDIYYQKGNTCPILSQRENFYNKALKNYLTALTFCEENGETSLIAASFVNIGCVYSKKKVFAEAISYFEKGIKLSKELGAKNLSCEGYKSLSETYFEMTDYKNAYQSHQLYSQYKDSILNETSSKQITEMQTKYETEKKENEITLLTNQKENLAQQNEIQTLQISRNRYLIFGLLSLAILVFLSAFLFIRQNKLKSLHAKTEMEKKLLDSNMKALRAQMNPHFIFNSLNSIQGLVNVNENRKASSFIAKFSKLTRGILNYSEQTTISLQDEIDFLRNYIEIESLRFDGNFEYSITLGENINAGDIQIPSLIVQPVIENAIVHGLFHKEGEKKLIIEVKEKEGMVTWEISDNGVGFNKSGELKPPNKNHTSTGIKNIKERLKLVSGNHAKEGNIEYMDLADEKGETGTKVIIKMTVV